MKNRCKVLILGSSQYSYTEADPAHAFPRLALPYLQQLAPEVEWETLSEIVYTTFTMPDRVQRLVEKHQPDAVVMHVSSIHFARNDVINALARKVPFLFKPARAFAQWLRDVSGGGPRGARSPRGWLYRAPRWLVERLVGSEPTLSLEDALDVVCDTTDRLMKVEDLHILVGLPFGRSRRNPVARERRRAFAAAMGKELVKRRLPYYRPTKARNDHGIERKVGPDGWHEVVEVRDFEAYTMARTLVFSLQNPSYHGEIELDQTPASGTRPVLGV